MKTRQNCALATSGEMHAEKTHAATTWTVHTFVNVFVIHLHHVYEAFASNPLVNYVNTRACSQSQPCSRVMRETHCQSVVFPLYRPLTMPLPPALTTRAFDAGPSAAGATTLSHSR